MFLTTQLEWSDLVLNQYVMTQIREIETWITHRDTLMKDWDIGKKLRPGYRVLFHGPPGTGKTLTASLLGKIARKDVFRIDLSTVISKYIGETEKNLASLFDKANNKDWILFFDEADALFGKRTNVKDSHDRYANQEIAYLLQRLEEYPGLAILVTNMRSNIDNAFLRRFQSVIYFPMPSTMERHKLWENGFSDSVELDKSVNLNKIAKKYGLSGGSIINIIMHCCLRAIRRDTNMISLDDILEEIKREYQKN